MQLQRNANVLVTVSLTVAAALFLDSCSKQPGIEYLPQSWPAARYEFSVEYSAPFSVVQKGQMVVRYDGQESINGKEYYKQVMVISGIPGVEIEPEIDYLRRTSSGLYMISGKHKDKLEFLSTPFPLTVGRTWIADGPESRVRYKAVSTETLELFGRRYENCLKVSAVTESSTRPFEATVYRAPGIGEVKGTIKYGGTAVTVEYTLQKFEQ